MCALPPTCKALQTNQYIEMMNYLLGHFFKKLSLNKHNYINLIIELMKKLNYPGILSKSWLQTAYSANSWPHVLGTLHWLVIVVKVFKENEDPLNFMFSVVEFDNEDKVKEASKSRRLFEYFLNSYIMWNENDSDGMEREKLKYLNYLSSLISLPDRERLEEEHSRLQLEMEEVQKDLEDEISKYDNIQKELYDSEKQFLKLNEEIEELKMMESKDVDLDHKILNWEEKFNVKQLEKIQIRTIIEKQDLSANEYESYINEKNYLEQEITSFKDDIGKFQESLNERNKEITESKMKIRKTMRDINLFVLTNVEKIPFLSDLVLDWSENEKEQEEQSKFIKTKIKEIETKNKDMKETIPKIQKQLDYDKHKNLCAIEELKLEKKQLLDQKIELENSTRRELESLETDIKNANAYKTEITQKQLDQEMFVESLRTEEDFWKEKNNEMREQLQEINENAKLRFSQLLELRRYKNERYGEMFKKMEKTFKEK